MPKAKSQFCSKAQCLTLNIFYIKQREKPKLCKPIFLCKSIHFLLKNIVDSRKNVENPTKIGYLPLSQELKRSFFSYLHSHLKLYQYCMVSFEDFILT